MDHPNLRQREGAPQSPVSQPEAVWGQSGGFAEQKLKQEAWDSKRKEPEGERQSVSMETDSLLSVEGCAGQHGSEEVNPKELTMGKGGGGGQRSKQGRGEVLNCVLHQRQGARPSEEAGGRWSRSCP